MFSRCQKLKYFNHCPFPPLPLCRHVVTISEIRSCPRLHGEVVTHHHHHHHNISFCAGHLFAEISMTPHNRGYKNTPLCSPLLWDLAQGFFGSKLLHNEIERDVSRPVLISMGKFIDNKFILNLMLANYDWRCYTDINSLQA